MQAGLGKMLLTLEMKAEIKEIKSKLHNEISERLQISLEELDKLKIYEIETRANIIPKEPKQYFAWEKGEKEGWQNSKYKIVTPEEYKRREEAVFSSK